MKPRSVEEAVDCLVQWLNGKFGYERLCYARSKGGSKYIRIERVEGDRRCAYCFVSLDSGDIYGASSWSKAGKCLKGSVFASDPLPGGTAFGPREGR